MGQPAAIVIILLVVPITAPPVTLIAALPDTLIAVPLATLTAVPTSIFTPPSPPSAWYLHPNTARDRLNHTLNSLAIGLKLVQPIATTPPKMQLSTPMAP